MPESHDDRTEEDLRKPRRGPYTVAGHTWIPAEMLQEMLQVRGWCTECTAKDNDLNSHEDPFLRKASPPEGSDKGTRWGVTRHELKGDGPLRVFVQGADQPKQRLKDELRCIARTTPRNVGRAYLSLLRRAHPQPLHPALLRLRHRAYPTSHHPPLCLRPPPPQQHASSLKMQQKKKCDGQEVNAWPSTPAPWISSLLPPKNVYGPRDRRCLQSRVQRNPVPWRSGPPRHRECDPSRTGGESVPPRMSG